MESISTYLNQITNSEFAEATVTLEQIVKERIKQRFNAAKEEIKKKVVEGFNPKLVPNGNKRGYRIVRDTTGKFEIGKVYGLDLPEKVKDYGWIPFQHEGGSLILHKVSLDVNQKRKEQQLELVLV